MRSKEFETIEQRDIINQDLIDIYQSLVNKPDYNLLLTLTNNHRKVINKSNLFGKNKLKSLKYLDFLAKEFKNDKSRALNNFMCMLNNRGLLIALK